MKKYIAKIAVLLCFSLLMAALVSCSGKTGTENSSKTPDASSSVPAGSSSEKNTPSLSASIPKTSSGGNLSTTPPPSSPDLPTESSTPLPTESNPPVSAEGVWMKTAVLPIREYLPFTDGTFTVELTLDMSDSTDFSLAVSFISRQTLYEALEKNGYNETQTAEKFSQITAEVYSRFNCQGEYTLADNAYVFLSEGKEIATATVDENLLFFRKDDGDLLFIKSGTSGNYMGYSQLVGVHFKSTTALPYVQNADDEKHGHLKNIATTIDFHSDTRVTYTMSLTEQDLADYKEFLAGYLEENYFAPLLENGSTKEQAEEQWKAVHGISSAEWVENTANAFADAPLGFSGFTSIDEYFMGMNLNNATIYMSARMASGLLVVSYDGTDWVFTR